MEDIKLIPIDEALEKVRLDMSRCDIKDLKRLCKEEIALIDAKYKNGFKYVDESYQPIMVDE